MWHVVKIVAKTRDRNDRVTGPIDYSDQRFKELPPFEHAGNDDDRSVARTVAACMGGRILRKQTPQLTSHGVPIIKTPMPPCEQKLHS